ncbi:MAG TPA: PQQ-dependent sugar dehydrogenase [Kofleriaceae bacterium]
MTTRRSFTRLATRLATRLLRWTLPAAALITISCGRGDRGSSELAASAIAQDDSDGVTTDPVSSMPAESPAPLAATADDLENPDPIPEEPRPSDLALVVEEFAQFPESAPFPPTTDPRLVRHARINFLTELQDGSGRMFTPDLNGTLYVITRHGTPAPYLDVRSMFPNFFSGRGLGSGFGFVAFHPDFARNGKFYTTHSEAFAALTDSTPDFTQANAVIQSVVTEWTATNPRANQFEGTHREMLRIGFGSFIHAIQEIGFNPTAHRHDPDFGLLYLAVGEGGQGVNGTDPQNLAIPHGKIIRIDPMGRNSANGKYGVPPSNPFVGRAGALGDIFAYGMRDPHRFSWDAGGTHRMFLGHIGEKHIESVVDVLPGDNFGWSEREGPFVFKRGGDPCLLFPLPPDDAQFGFVYPVIVWDHNRPPNIPCSADAGHAVSGGYVYRGPIAALRGKYIFGDLVDGRILFSNESEMVRGGPRATIHEMKLLDSSGRLMSMQELVGDTRIDLRFSVDNQNALYLLSKSNGKIYKVVDAKRFDDVLPSLVPNLVAHYDFEQPVAGKPFLERDRGSSDTTIDLINGGAAMRVQDGAHLKSKASIQLQQVDTDVKGENDWKAGIYSATGVPSLHAFNAVQGVTIMAWVKMTGANPSLNTETPDPNDFFNAIGLTGLLTGDSEGHAVRALLEIINVNVNGVNELHLVALGRRIDGSASQTFAANDPWPTLLPQNEWVFLAATFDFNTGALALYRNGEPLSGFLVTPGDPWGVATPGTHVSSATDPRGIKIGGSFPQNTQERNPCNCRMDSIMFLDRVVQPREVRKQFRLVTRASHDDDDGDDDHDD